jgi:serine/threonine protein kinase
MHGGESVFDYDGNQYTIVRRVGGGSFGVVYHALRSSDGMDVCIKMENERDDATGGKILEHEYRVLKLMMHFDGMPKVFGRGTAVGSSKNAKFICMEYLGPSLESIMRFMQRPFSPASALTIGLQIITLLKQFHGCGYVHRDIKPDNFVMGQSNHKRVFAIDFGLAKRFLSRDGREAHIPLRTGKSLVGTPRYCSINANAGMEHSRRDDIESVIYMLVFLCRGTLPWQGMHGANPDEKYASILASKRSLTSQQLCAGLPDSFAIVLDMARAMEFAQCPDYRLITTLFRRDLATFGPNPPLDWLVNGHVSTQVKTVSQVPVDEKSRQQNLSAMVKGMNQLCAVPAHMW